VRINHKKVLRIMRNRGLTHKPKRRWIKTTDSNHACKIYPNLLQNNPVIAINQVWVADITYISYDRLCLSGSNS
jgi:putative transposase